MTKSDNAIIIRGAKEHNLKNIDAAIPKNQLVVITGPSGSGKSSLAFDTIYAEGQRRYVESLSSYARQFLNIQDKPDVESIDGLSPAIAIDQKTTSRNPRSTVGTVTEIYDYLRLLYARVGVPYSPATGLPIESQTVSQMADRILELPEGTKIMLLAPVVRGHKGEYRKELAEWKKKGFQRFKINGSLYEADELPALDKNKKHEIDVVVDRIVVSGELGNRLPDSLETALQLGDGLVKVEVVSIPAKAGILNPETKGTRSPGRTKGAPEDITTITFSSKFACPISGFTLSEIEPRLFSFNSPYGACPTCDGLGMQMFFDPDLVVPDTKLSLLDKAIAPWANSTSKYYIQTLDGLSAHYGFKLTTAFRDLPKEIQEIILYGSGEEPIKIAYTDGPRTYMSHKPYEGVIPSLERRWKETESEWMRDEITKYQNDHPCESCGGHRLKPEALCVKVGGLHIGEVTQFPIDTAHDWFGKLEKKLSKKQQDIAQKILKEIRERLTFLVNVGLEYLTLSRESGTLSGGESQRIRLASQIGSGLSGVLYVLDEPSIGLHQCDNQRLLTTLKHLRDLGNTVIVVEHDEDTMRASDYLIDMGPGAGVHGGRIVAEGSCQQVMKNKSSLTGQYLSGDKFIAVPSERRPIQRSRKIVVSGARANNLKNIKAEFPLSTFTCVTGVSGGGKSSLVIETLYKAIAKRMHGSRDMAGVHDSITGLESIDKIIEIDQSPIGRTPRSNPATYTGAFTPIRDWFAALPEAKARGYQAGRFSFNVKGGRCEACQGDGLIKIEMHFLPDVYVKCDVCHGKRYNRETLDIRYKDKSIADVLEMTVDEGASFFSAQTSIREKLVALQEVGLGYIAIGQSATTLSGGEAQRIKLAKELSKRATGRTLYILDEPTTGLHSDDIRKLLGVLHTLVDSGNTIICIEHNLDVIKTADWVIDIGPGGGNKGGKVVASGTPEDIAACKESVTGEYLKPLLKKGKKVA
ncbi:MAG: excinuclease ABC subunit UvrA [Rickettsiales bacterium]|jgi:excinuclease ABC subunit A|nr:excinuclease ABC subunit UvrA [Rickettsiales bacterium]